MWPKYGRRFASDVVRQYAKSRERRRALTYFDQRHIDHIAQQQHYPIPAQNLHSPDKVTREVVTKFAAEITHTCPQRIAECIMLFRRLPFVVGCNEPIQKVHEEYVKSLRHLCELGPFSQSTDWHQIQRLVTLCEELIQDNSEVLPLLIEGTADSHGFSNFSPLDGNEGRSEEAQRRIKRFMTKILRGRMSLRLLLNHFVRLVEQVEEPVETRHGVLTLDFSPRMLLQNIYEEQKPIAEDYFGFEMGDLWIRQANNLSDGQPVTRFPYLIEPIEYAVREIVKNALRAQAKAQLESAQNRYGSIPDPMEALVVYHDRGFAIRVTDYGSGVSDESLERIWDFNESIETPQEDSDGGSFEQRKVELEAQFIGLGSGVNDRSLFGYGCGLPISKLYTEMMGGTISLQTIEGYGTNVHFNMPYIIDQGISKRVIKSINL